MLPFTSCLDMFKLNQGKPTTESQFWFEPILVIADGSGGVPPTGTAGGTPPT